MVNWILVWTLFMISSDRSLPDSSFVRNINKTYSNAFCALSVNAGEDIDICIPGGHVELAGTVIGDAVYHIWSPSFGLSNPEILNPVATVTDTITYTLTALGMEPDSQNILINGDFELGNVGFYSPYHYIEDVPGYQEELYTPGRYTVIDSPDLVNDTWPPCTDHTGGSGSNMFVVNGTLLMDTIWCQTVNVTPNSYYYFSAWVAVVDETGPPDLFVYVNGEYIGAKAIPGSYACFWDDFDPGVWESGNSTTAEICIINEPQFLWEGFDFALDDISFVGLCSVSDEVNINLVDDIAPEPVISGSSFVCEGTIVTYSTTFEPEIDIVSYQWTLTPGGTVISGQGTNEISVLWGDSVDADVCLTIHTFCHSNSNCISVTIEHVPSPDAISGDVLYCPGEIATLSVPPNESVDIYEWILPQGINILGGDNSNSIIIEWIDLSDAEVCVQMSNECGTTLSCIALALFPGYITLFDTILCEGETIIINENTYGNGVMAGTEIFTATDGCDSLVEIEITNASKFAMVVSTMICAGDSVYLQNGFQQMPGIYIDSFVTIYGCDSLLITNLEVVVQDTTWTFSTTCVPDLAGTDIMTYNLEQCDSVVIHQTFLLESDTTYISLFTCFPPDTGQTIQGLINTDGCDSILIQTTYLLLPDTTHFFESSCDSFDTGVSVQALTNVHGCDSIVINTVSFLSSDTTLFVSVVCTYGDTGTISTLFTNHAGCDSLVIIRKMYAGSDTTFLSESTCNPADSGLVTTSFINQSGCDSIVSTIIQLNFSDTTYLNEISCESQDTGVTIQFLYNNHGCDSLVITSTSFDEPENCELQARFSIIQPNCYGDSAWIEVEILVGQGPFEFQGLFDSMPGNAIYASPGLYLFPLYLHWRGGPINMRMISGNQLELMDTLLIEDPFPLEINAEIISDYNGYSVPCYGDSIGRAKAEVIDDGMYPFTIQWSNGETSAELNNLSAGVYNAYVMNSRGCKDSSEITITEPEHMEFVVNVQEIDCHDSENGSITITGIEGGILPWIASLNSASFQDELFFNSLSAGTYDLLVQDLNGCKKTEKIELDEPAFWNISLGKDTIVAIGTKVELSATINGQAGMLHWEWADDPSEKSSTRSIEINSAITYSVTATDIKGCTEVDSISFDVFHDGVYVPNIFSPNGDQINDLLTIETGPDLLEIEEFTLFDRWGNQVFQKHYFLPDDPGAAWDGKFRGIESNIGVYPYKLIVVFSSNRREVILGNITLIR